MNEITVYNTLVFEKNYSMENKEQNFRRISSPLSFVDKHGREA